MVPKWAADIRETLGSKLGWGSAVGVLGGTLYFVKYMADDLKADVRADVKDLKSDMGSRFDKLEASFKK